MSIREPATSPAKIDELIGPLAAVAERCGLIGVTDRAGLHEALAPYSSDAIRHAVAQVARMAKAGQIRSPLGWLIAAGRRRDPDLFQRPPATGAPPPPTAGVRIEQDLRTEAAERAVAAAGADELAVLDNWIRTAPHHARIRHLIFEPNRGQEMLHAARLEAWLALQEAS